MNNILVIASYVSVASSARKKPKESFRRKRLSLAKQCLMKVERNFYFGGGGGVFFFFFFFFFFD